MGDLVISTQEGNGDVVLSVAGEIDFGNVAELRTTLARLIKATTGNVTVDLEEVTFLDSTALGVLIQAKRRLLERNDDLVVTNPHPRVARIFEISGLREYLGA
ncbi:MAG TPA: STAS domain-containing protein [Acidimicrobiia bacterium]|nr:STAS domain-containing protein [Acidimicrobiia bacterium]